MIWLPVLALAGAAFLIAAFVLRVPRAAWSILGAALMLGLTGYALQGSPGLPGSPRSAAPEELASDGAAMVDARRGMFDPAAPPAPFVTVADGFARRGKFEDAANLLSGAVRDEPSNGEAWLALGSALAEHAEGQLTPAALYAFRKADSLLPGHPGPPYFIGVAFIRSGQFVQARALWADALARAPEDAVWRPELAERLARLDQLIEQTGGR